MAFSIKHLLLVMLVAAVGIAAFKNADLPIVAELFDLFVPLAIVLMGYQAWVSAGEKRASRIGFVSWGSVYFLLSRWWLLAFHLATGQLIWLLQRPLQPTRIRQLTGDAFSNAEANRMDRTDTIGHCLFALLFGLVGGWVTVYFYRKRQRMLSRANPAESPAQQL